MIRPLTTHGIQVRYSRWEIAGLGLWGVLLLAAAVWLVSEGKVVASAFMLFVFVGTVAWDVYARRARPEFYAERRSTVAQLVATALLVAGGGVTVIFADGPAVKLLGGLFALAVVATVIGDRTRPLPDPSVAIGKEESMKRYETGMFVGLFVFIVVLSFLGA